MIAPVDLGQALAFPEVYMEWPAGLPAPAPAPRARRRGGIGRKVAALAAVAVAAGLALAGCATPASAATQPAEVTVASPVVRHSETVTARFGVCVADVQAYALRGPFGDTTDYSAASTVHHGAVRARRAVRLVFRFTAADAGRWGALEVTGWECGKSRTLPDGSPDWSHLVTVTSGAMFTVVAR